MASAGDKFGLQPDEFVLSLKVIDREYDLTEKTFDPVTSVVEHLTSVPLNLKLLEKEDHADEAEGNDVRNGEIVKPGDSMRFRVKLNEANLYVNAIDYIDLR